MVEALGEGGAADAVDVRVLVLLDALGAPALDEMRRRFPAVRRLCKCWTHRDGDDGCGPLHLGWNWVFFVYVCVFFFFFWRGGLAYGLCQKWN